MTPESRVRFGAGLRHEVADEVRRLGARRVLVLSTPRQSAVTASLLRDLGALAAGVYDGAEMHTPVAVTDAALRLLTDTGADCVLAVGGGSTIGLAKALAWRTDVLQVVLPTTYSGSEMTPVLGQTENGVKTTFADPKVLPEVVLYDPALVVSLPADISVASGLNAMAHAAEALYADNRTAISSGLALDGLYAFLTGFPAVIAAPGDLAARTLTLQGACACGRLLGLVRMALHHKLCHVLGGGYGLPHAQTHAVILPHAIGYNARSAATELRPLADLLGADSAGRGLYAFARRMGAPLALKDLGMTEADLDGAAGRVARQDFPNPHPVTRDEVRAMLKAAWAGDQPLH